MFGKFPNLSTDEREGETKWNLKTTISRWSLTSI